MLLVPLSPLPSQTISIVLGGQVCTINVYQKFSAMYVDLYVNDVIVIGGVIAENLNRIVRYAYLGFSGDLFFADLQGTTDPVFAGLGDQYQMYYLTAAEVAAITA